MVMLLRGDSELAHHGSYLSHDVVIPARGAIDASITLLEYRPDPRHCLVGAGRTGGSTLWGEKAQILCEGGLEWHLLPHDYHVQVVIP
jgi:hypothetical protein